MLLRKLLIILMASGFFFTQLTGCTLKDAWTEAWKPDFFEEEQKAEEAEISKTGLNSVELTFWSGPDWTGIYSADEKDAKNGDFWRFAAEEFSRNECPNVKINVEIFPYANTNEKINVALASNSPPDIWFYTTFNQYDVMSRGAVVPLDDMITEEDRRDIDKTIWDNMKYDGKVYSWPFSWITETLIANVDLFEKMNALSYLPKNEERTWTMEEFKAALKAVTDNGKSRDHYGLGLFAKDVQADTWNFMYLWAFGAKTFSEDCSQIVLNSPEGVKALAFMKSLVDEGLTAPDPEALTAEDTINMFTQGKLAVCMGQPKYSTFIDRAVEEGTLSNKFKHMFVMMPGDEPSFVPAFYGSVVFDVKDADRIKYAKQFVKFSSSEPYSKAAKAALTIPVKTSLVEELYADNEEYAYFLKIFKYATGNLHSEVRGYTEIRNKLYPELQAVFTGAKTPQQALNDFAKAGNEILEKYAR
jgi:multiple sugar transport system substrate-binding protein